MLIFTYTPKTSDNLDKYTSCARDRVVPRYVNQKKIKDFLMRTLLLTASAIVFAGALQAAEVTGKIAIDFRDLNSALAATPSLSFGTSASAGNASVGLKVDGSGNIYVDRWKVGTTMGGVALSYGDQKDLFQLGAGLEKVGGDTLANPAESATSLIAGFSGVQVLVGLGDATTDTSDVANLQVATEVAGATVVVDYNLGTTDVVFGLAYTVADVNLTATYADQLAYEAGYTFADYGVAVYVNGDESNFLQNVGAGYSTKLADGASVYAEANYNVDTQTMTPAAGISFSF